jgi:hypothetical protein
VFGRHGDPGLSGLTSGEKSTLSRGQVPKGVHGDEAKTKAAREYLSEKVRRGRVGGGADRGLTTTLNVNTLALAGQADTRGPVSAAGGGARAAVSA